MSETDIERIDELLREYGGYDRGIKLGEVFGTAKLGEFLDALAHARRSVEAEVAEGEKDVAWDAYYNDNPFNTASDHEDALDAALAAVALWRAAHPVPVAIDEAMVERAAIAMHEDFFGLADAEFSFAGRPDHLKNRYRSHARAALSAALNPPSEGA